MGTEIQQLLMSALTNLTKEYQKQSNEHIEREKTLINVLEQLQSDQSVQNEACQNMQESYKQTLQIVKEMKSQINSLSEQNLQLVEQLEKLFLLYKK